MPEIASVVVTRAVLTAATLILNPLVSPVTPSRGAVASSLIVLVTTSETVPPASRHPGLDPRRAVLGHLDRLGVGRPGAVAEAVLGGQLTPRRRRP